MGTVRRVNKHKTVQNVKERLNWIIRLEEATGLHKCMTVDNEKHLLLLTPEDVAELPERVQQMHKSLETIVNDLNRVKNPTARKILIERFHGRYIEQYSKVGAPKLSDYDIIERWGWGKTKYYNYRLMGMLDFAGIHAGGELLAYDEA